MSDIQALARGLKVLDLLIAADDGISITAIARELDINKSTASRIIQTLVNYQWAESHPTQRLYRVGRKLSLVNATLSDYERLRQLAHPFLHYLVQSTGECAHIAVYLDEAVYVLDDVESDSMLRVSAGVGRTTYLHCTAVGKVLLAFAHISVPEILESFTDNTITDKLHMQTHLQQIRKQGFAIDDEEFELGVRCIAVPIFGYANRCIASIGISGPTVRIHDETIDPIVHDVKRIGMQLSNICGSQEKETAQ